VTDARGEHAQFDELAAGYALHALDPEDERQFLRHLSDCPRCREALSDYTEVAAALADNPSTIEPSPQLGDRIMAAIANEPAGGAGRPPQQVGAGRDGSTDRDSTGRDSRSSGSDGIDRGDSTGRDSIGRDGQGDKLPAGITDLSERRHRRRLVAIVASAAAAIVIAGGTIWGGLASSGGSSPSQPTAGCMSGQTCRQVLLTDAHSHAPAGKVVISGHTVWLLPSGLPADNTTRQIYVLWQITGAHTPMAVGSFDVTGHGDKPVRIGSLAVPYRGTWAFAVSIEHGRTIPATPSHPVALGQVPS
jgi:Anti-sigma-K factor rskA/Putative zinc-finger